MAHLDERRCAENHCQVARSILQKARTEVIGGIEGCSSKGASDVAALGVDLGPSTGNGGWKWGPNGEAHKSPMRFTLRGNYLLTPKASA